MEIHVHVHVKSEPLPSGGAFIEMPLKNYFFSKRSGQTFIGKWAFIMTNAVHVLGHYIHDSIKIPVTRHIAIKGVYVSCLSLTQ